MKNKGSFKKGCIPWNKGKSIRLNPKGEFKQGHKPWNKGLKGKYHLNHSDIKERTERMRKIGKANWLGGSWKKEGYIILNINGKKINRSHFVWLKHNQLHRIPAGCVLHHVNGIKDDDRIENLQLLTNSYHANLHWRIRKFLNK